MRNNFTISLDYSKLLPLFSLITVPFVLAIFGISLAVRSQNYNLIEWQTLIKTDWLALLYGRFEVACIILGVAIFVYGFSILNFLKTKNKVSLLKRAVLVAGILAIFIGFTPSAYALITPSSINPSLMSLDSKLYRDCNLLYLYNYNIWNAILRSS